MLYTLKEVFENKIFRIPAYQRGYSWEMKQIQQLWDDIQNIHYPHPNNSFHFTGILTLNKFDESSLERLENENHGYEINDFDVEINEKSYVPYQLVDGQQRLTTLLILISLLIDSIENDPGCPENLAIDVRNSKSDYLVLLEDGETKHLFGYETDVPSHQYLLNKIFDDETIECNEPETLYTNRLGDAKVFFSEKLVELDINQKEALFRKIESRLLFAILKLNETENRTIDVSMAFETLNFRGKELTNLELLKNRLLYLVNRTSFVADIKEKISIDIINTWLIIYKWLGLNRTNELKDDEFLKAFWLLRFSDATMVAKDFKEWEKDIFQRKFSLDLKPNKNEYISQRGLNGIHVWLQDLRKSIELWFIIKNPYYFDEVENQNNVVETQFILNDEIKDLLFKVHNFPNGLGGYTQNLILSILSKNLPTQNEIEDLDDDDDNEDDYVSHYHNIIIGLLKAIERHNFANFILNGNKTVFNREKIYRCINNYFRTGYGAVLNAGNIERKINLLYYIENDLVDNIRLSKIQFNFHKEANRFLDWPGLEYVLLNWEIYFAKQNGEMRADYKELKNKNLKKKLIYPDANNHNYRANFEQINRVNLNTRDRYSFSLGNIYLSRTNRRYFDFEELLNTIQNSDDSTYQEINIFENNKDNIEWTTDEIVERGKEIFLFIVQNWNLQGVGDIQSPGNYSNTRWLDLLID